MHQYGRMPTAPNVTDLAERFSAGATRTAAFRARLEQARLQTEYLAICETPAGETFTAKAARLARLYTLVVTHGCGADPEGC